MSEVLRFLSAVRLADVLDILVVAILMYVVARWLLQRASIAVAVGLSLVTALYLAAGYWSMYLTLAVYRGGAVLIIIVLAIVFQDDIRRGIERLAAWRPGRLDGVARPLKYVKATIADAVASLAQRGLGALIVLSGREPLEAHVRGGIALDGQPSVPLLLSIFDHQTPGHDGAAIFDGPVITHFAAHLPLSKNLSEIGAGGTRHAAALGLSEWCDALVIAVSEERGTICVAEQGKLTQVGSPAELDRRMEAFYSRQDFNPAQSQTKSKIADWALKGGSLAAACLLWGVFAFRVDTVEQVIENVPVEYRNLPPGWQVEGIDPAALQVRLSGPERAFDQLDRTALRVSLEPGDYELKSGTQQIEVPSDALELPRGVELAPGDPPTIRLMLERIVTVEAKIQPQLVGDPPQTHRVSGVSVAPEKLRVTIPARYIQRARTLRTAPIDLAEVRQSFTREIEVELPPGGELVGRPKNRVSVTVEVVAVEPEGG